GPNLRGSLRGMSATLAAWRPAVNRHSIAEIALHAAYWKYTVRCRLLGEKRGSFPLTGSNWFARPDVISEETWKSDVALLDETHRTLRAAVAALRPADLDRKPSGSTVNTLNVIM